MKPLFIIITLMVLATFTQGFSQQQTVLPKGDTVAARRSKHHEFRGTSMIAQVGYIDTNVATRKELIDNLAIGLVPVPRLDYEIESFSIGMQGRWPDFVGPFSFSGNKINDRILRNYMAYLTPGETVFFEYIKARRKGSDHSVWLPAIHIRVIQ